jgi:hypothetical protein
VKKVKKFNLIISLNRFLKPNRIKILVFAILLIVSLLYERPCAISQLYESKDLYPLLILSTSFQWHYSLFGIHGVCIGLLFPYVIQFFLDETYYILLIQSILNIIIWYMLSCLTVWSYNKFKKRKK